MIDSNIVVALIFLLGLLTGMPIAFVLLGSAFAGLMMLRGFDVALNALATMPFSKTADVALSVIPLFILMGYLASQAGVSANAYKIAYRWLGHIRGGLGIATVAACAAFAATSGSSVATSAAVGKIAFTEMKRFRYNEAISAGTIAAAGLLGIMIPPSIMLVVYGVITQTDISRLFLAGILPGLLTAFVFSAGLYLIALFKPQLMPVASERFSWRERFETLKDGWGVAALFFVIIGGIYAGFFTANEAAAVGAVAAFLLLILRRGFRLGPLIEGGLDAASTSAMIFLILIGAGLLGQYVALSGLATDISRLLAASEWNRYVVLFLILLAYVPLGMFLEPISMCLITLPIVFPVIQHLGFDAIWFGILIVKMSELANITPPLGVNVFVVKGVIPGISLDDTFKGASLFVILEVITILLLIIFPQISLFIPSMMN
ncbi:TRAP transporter large permease [Rhodoligotrophos ferricapiens]|uniref:TRAP transporter large permease n=1 Tax=Rhodoligotrophos ferricapiens TaxID=3069264 RepID=UPI00315D1C57